MPLDPDNIRPAWKWIERLILYTIGAAFAGFCFCGALGTFLSSPNRPIFPDPVLGFTYLFKAKYGYVYGTYLEYLSVTYGPLSFWGIAVIAGSLIPVLSISEKPSVFSRPMLAAAVVSMPLYYLIWRLST